MHKDGVMPIDRDQRAQIGEAVTRLERDFYGRGPSSVRVTASDGTPEIVTVLSLDTLTTSDRTLAERGGIGAIRAHHQAVHEVTSDDFRAEVRAIVGEEPSAYFAQVDPHTGSAVRVFVFADPDR